MYKPAPYLIHQFCPYQLELLRIRTQHTIHIIPSQLHYAFQHARADYKDRCARTALLQAQQYLGTNSTLYVTAQPPRWSSKSSMINFNASIAYWTFPLSLPSHQIR